MHSSGHFVHFSWSLPIVNKKQGYPSLCCFYATLVVVFATKIIFIYYISVVYSTFMTQNYTLSISLKYVAGSYSVAFMFMLHIIFL